MRSPIPFAAALLAAIGPAAFPAEAQRTASASAGEERIRQVVVYGRDACPRGTGDEVVICARRPESERYRIPRAVRERGRLPGPGSTSWAARARSLERLGQTGIQSCSTVGPGGFTGCWEEMMRAARAERAAARDE